MIAKMMTARPFSVFMHSAKNSFKLVKTNFVFLDDEHFILIKSDVNLCKHVRYQPDRPQITHA